MKTKGEKTKQHIVEIAAELFWKNSYQGVNTITISRAAGVNKATMYRYFPSKDNLALAVIENYCDRTLAYVFEGSFQATADPVERLKEIYRRVYQTHQDTFDQDASSPGCPFVNIVVEMGTTNAEIRQATEQCFQRFGEYYRQIVRDAKRLGISPDNLDEDRAVQTLINVMNGAMVSSKIKNRPEEILAMAPVAELVLKG
ncbi:MAG: TetR/AcrR family transcriptional regulator [Elainellaceae cyanobacterium]